MRHPAFRNRSPGPTLELVHGVAAVAPRDWAATDTFLELGYLAALEDTCPGLRFDLAILRRGSRAVAGAVFQTVDLDVDRHLPALSQGFDGAQVRVGLLRSLVKRLLSSLRLRLVLCGNGFLAGPHASWRLPEVDDPAHRAFLHEAAARVRARVSARGVHVLSVFKDLDPGDPVAREARGYLSLSDDPPMALVLDPAWRTLDDYAASLRTRYRAELQRARRRAAAAGLRRRSLGPEEIRRHAARLEELYQAVLARARAAPVRKGAETFARLAEALGERFSLEGYFVGEHLVAFNTRFRAGDELESHFFGMDYQVSQELALYRNLLYDDLADAIALRCRRLLLGRASQEIKSALGAEPEPTVTLIRHESRALTALLGLATRWLAPAPWPRRRPFRQAPAGPRVADADRLRAPASTSAAPAAAATCGTRGAAPAARAAARAE